MVRGSSSWTGSGNWKAERFSKCYWGRNGTRDGFHITTWSHETTTNAVVLQTNWNTVLSRYDCRAFFEDRTRYRSRAYITNQRQSHGASSNVVPQESIESQRWECTVWTWKNVMSEMIPEFKNEIINQGYIHLDSTCWRHFEEILKKTVQKALRFTAVLGPLPFNETEVKYQDNNNCPFIACINGQHVTKL